MDTNGKAEQALNAHSGQLLEFIFAWTFSIIIRKLNNKHRKDEL